LAVCQYVSRKLLELDDLHSYSGRLSLIIDATIPEMEVAAHSAKNHGELNRFAVLCRRPAATCGVAAYGLRHFGSAVTRVWRDCAIIASGTLLRPR